MNTSICRLASIDYVKTMSSTEARPIRDISAIYRGSCSSRKRKERPFFHRPIRTRYLFLGLRGCGSGFEMLLQSPRLLGYVRKSFRIHRRVEFLFTIFEGESHGRFISLIGK